MISTGFTTPAFWRDSRPAEKIAMGLGVALIATALIGPFLVAYDPASQSLLSRLRPPMGIERAAEGHILGTDELGRDLLTRAVYGLRMTLGLALFGAIIGLCIGSAIGLLAGMRGGKVETFLMAAVDVQIAVPFTLIALLVLSLFGSNMLVLVVLLGISGWEQYARIVRAEVRRIMAMNYIEAARLSGASHWVMARDHVLPNILAPLVVQFTLSLAAIMLLESTLSFLGLGVQPPTATLGVMVGHGRPFLSSAPWIVLTPAFLIMSIVFVVQILGDWLRDRTDIRLRAR